MIARVEGSATLKALPSHETVDEIVRNRGVSRSACHANAFAR